MHPNDSDYKVCDCCLSCKYHIGDIDNETSEYAICQCELHGVNVLTYGICDKFESAYSKTHWIFNEVDLDGVNPHMVENGE